ncbi:MAG: T9SS type A sorting domain-containing protein [Ignavibacteria bacterium]|nr:T9SS type A sorting domain-containing protein [Ignavibacteria bacterium]
MKFYVIFLTFFVIVTASALYSVDTNSTKFFPLKIGNQWTYMRTINAPPPNPYTYYFKCTVTKDTVIGSHKYYYFSRTDHMSGFGGGASWFRVDSTDGKLISFTTYACNQFGFETVDSLASSVNNFSKICPNDTLQKRKLISISGLTAWGLQTTELSFDWNSGPALFPKKYYKHFGLIYSAYGEMYPIVFWLKGCVIDGILYGDTNTFVGINQINSEVPNKFSLSQNYPNPFNPSTKIKFQIPLSRGVDAEGGRGVLTTLVVYDALGREIQTLFNLELKPGTYEVDFDGSNLPSGVYYYTLISGEFNETKRMVLLK